MFNKKAKRKDYRVLKKYFKLYDDAITKRVADKSLETEVENSKKKKKVKFPEDAAVLLLISFFTLFLFPSTASTLNGNLQMHALTSLPQQVQLSSRRTRIPRSRTQQS